MIWPMKFIASWRSIGAFIFCFLLASTPVRAAGTCPYTMQQFMERYIKDAGYENIYSADWYRDCIHPEMRGDRLWGALETYIIDARLRGEKVAALTVTPRSVRLDYTTVSHSFRYGMNEDGQIVYVGSDLKAAINLEVPQILARLKALPGVTSALIQSNGKDLFTVDPDRPLQVSSSIKLGVLHLIIEGIKANKFGWDTVVTMREEHKALPSGTLQNLPTGTRFTIDSLAGLMMRDSDNTATDMLIEQVGAENLATYFALPYFMTFHQWFMLKSKPADYAVFKAMDEAARKTYLAALKPAVPLIYEEAVFSPTPASGWHVSTRKLCDAMATVADDPDAQLESTLLTYDEWSKVSSKAGGDESSRNDTLRLVRNDDATYCLSVTWNTETTMYTDQEYLYTLGSLIEAIRRIDKTTGELPKP
jgi:beta-lactamase class A